MIQLDQNKIDDESLVHLGEFIEESKHIEIVKMSSCNNITDNGVEILANSVIGNTTLNEIRLDSAGGITNKSVSVIVDMIKKSKITKFSVAFGAMDMNVQEQIEEALLIPIEKREIPIKSNTKSAAKTM